MKILLYTLFMVMGTLAFGQELYTEKFRPQYHPSPSSNFMGDPNGPIKYGGNYYFYWWGQHSSADMVRWKEETKYALFNTPGGYGNWSGCMVIDEDNVSGLGSIENPAWLAFYTLNNNSNGFQQQAVSVGNSPGSYLSYYQVVIPNESPDFRDPQVFWHEESSKWIMVVTRPIDRSIEIYSSDNLLDWTYQSTFSGYGANREVWEVPDLFQLPVNGNQSDKKWVMTCGMGPNRMQYWVGDFDGSTFTIADNDNLITGKHFPGEVFEDFESGYDNWTVEGSAFGSQPATGTLPDQMAVSGWTGNGFVNSYAGGDASIGKLISPEFTITKPFINFQVGGGDPSGNAIRVIVNGNTIASAKSLISQERLVWLSFDVNDYMGQQAIIEIEDAETGGWGHILVDHIVFSDVAYHTRYENANWADWGQDFYAGKSFRNYDNDDARKLWFAWMGNWSYAQAVPTNPWKGCESITREIELLYNEDGYRLIQKPIVELESLRNAQYTDSNVTVTNEQTLDGYKAPWNVYEMKVSFKVDNKDQDFGVKLAQGKSQEAVIGYKANSSTLYFSRIKGPYYYNGRRTAEMPIELSEDGILDLHIFIDQSSVEIFAEDYRHSMTNLFFNYVNETGISLFSNSGSATVDEINIWDLNSIYDVNPENVEKPEIDIPTSINSYEHGAINIFPNPASERVNINLPAQVNNGIITLISSTGKPVLQRTINEPTLELDLKGLSQGVYFLKFSGSEFAFTQKILKE